MVLFHFWYGPLERHQSLEDNVVEEVLKIKDRISLKIKKDGGSADLSRNYNQDQIFDLVAVGAGFSAIICAVILFLKKKEKRACIVSVLLGAGAITFSFLSAALGAILLVILVAAVLGSLGLG
ncbi:MAG: hypothetical protein CSB24_03565 [Deltaproteobacteria bacterium]|nr:MAG: hypothetical protein CSB24_03565 [Deltaproteobacteria bacterium]